MYHLPKTISFMIRSHVSDRKTINFYRFTELIMYSQQQNMKCGKMRLKLRPNWVSEHNAPSTSNTLKFLRQKRLTVAAKNKCSSCMQGIGLKQDGTITFKFWTIFQDFITLIRLCWNKTRVVCWKLPQQMLQSRSKSSQVFLRSRVH